MDSIKVSLLKLGADPHLVDADLAQNFSILLTSMGRFSVESVSRSDVSLLFLRNAEFKSVSETPASCALTCGFPIEINGMRILHTIPHYNPSCEHNLKLYLFSMVFSMLAKLTAMRPYKHRFGTAVTILIARNTFQYSALTV